LHEAAANGNDKALEVLLTGGADRNSKDALVSTKQVTFIQFQNQFFLFSAWQYTPARGVMAWSQPLCKTIV
jgi:hypothetical protein